MVLFVLSLNPKLAQYLVSAFVMLWSKVSTLEYVLVLEIINILTSDKRRFTSSLLQIKAYQLADLLIAITEKPFYSY